MILIDKKYKTVWISGHEVKIIYKKRLLDNAYGYFHPDKDLIEVKNGPEWKDTLLHEILHGALYYSGQSQKFKEEDEEALVMMFENCLKTLVFS